MYVDYVCKYLLYSSKMPLRNLILKPMDIEKEREKRNMLVKNIKRLSLELDSIIKNNINLVSDILSLNLKPPITDWPKKAVVLRVCDWTNQIRRQIEEIAFNKLSLCKERRQGLLPHLKIDLDFKPVEEPTPWDEIEDGSFTEGECCPCEKGSFTEGECCSCEKVTSLNLQSLDCEDIVNLLKTEFVYKKLIEKACDCPSKTVDDYFFTTSIDFKTGSIDFYGEEDKMQSIKPSLSLDSYETINSYFTKPLFLKIGVTSLKLFLFRSKIKIGVLYFYSLLGESTDTLEQFSFSSEIEKKLVAFIREDDILNEEFRDVLYGEINKFIGFLFNQEISEYSKFLILNFLLISFSCCLSHFDQLKFRKSQYFYLVKWAL